MTSEALDSQAARAREMSIPTEVRTSAGWPPEDTQRGRIPLRRSLVRRALDAASRDDPFDDLSRDGGDAVEVGVVVKDDEAGGLSGCRDEEVGDG